VILFLPFLSPLWYMWSSKICLFQVQSVKMDHMCNVLHPQKVSIFSVKPIYFYIFLYKAMFFLPPFQESESS
jgi:hypothetical protein